MSASDRVGRLCGWISFPAAVIATAGVLCAPVASASVEFYFDAVRAKVKAQLTDSEALQLGDVACRALRTGLNKGLSFGQARHEADQAVGYASYQLGLDLTLADGMNLVGAAEDQLC